MATACLSLIFVPLTLHAFGPELYGVLGVTWMVLGYLAWLDFGFSRASARYVSRDLAQGRLDSAASWAWTAILTQLCLGFCGGAILSVFVPLLVNHLHVQAANKHFVALSLHLFAFSIPLTLANRTINGVLQAGQSFGRINALNFANSILTYFVYGVAIFLGRNFLFVVWGLFVLQVLGVAGSYLFACQVLPALKSLRGIKLLRHGYGSSAREMLCYGSWLTVASLIGPLLLTFDQWMISFIGGISVLPFYTVPFNLLNRLNLFPSSISSTLFPAFSGLHAKSEWERIESYFIRAHRFLAIVLLPILFLLFTWSREILRLWLGAEFASQGATPLRILVLGFGIGLLAPFSGVLLEGIGRPDVVAKLYLVELPFNLVVVYVLTKHYGIVGAALSYTIRTIVETILIWALVYHLVPLSLLSFIKRALVRPGLTILIVGLVAWVIRNPHLGSYFEIAGTILTLAMYGIAVPTLVLDRTDRNLLLSLWANRRASIT